MGYTIGIEIKMNIREIILEKLDGIEKSEDVKVLYACESGSRAWGFPSADSDYDVRFIYVHPLDWYLSVFEQRDVIEVPINDSLDINGWDLKKTLGLLSKSNPPLLEWLGSPIIYRENTEASNRLRKLAESFYSPTSCAYHYLHMARGNFREYLQGDEVWTKKYFYVLRPVLAINWIEAGLGVPPTDFNIVLDRIVTDSTLRAAIDKLLVEKRAGNELRKGPRIAPISNYIESQLTKWGEGRFQHVHNPSTRQELDQTFREIIKTFG